MNVCIGMTDVYQVCDTHINGVIKSQLAEYWSSEIVRDPNHPVPITKMINQTTKILNEMPKTMIKDAFDETAFQPALLAAEDDDTQIVLLMDDLMDEIEHNDNDWLSLYNEIMSHFPSLHGQNDNDEVELNQLEVQDEESNTSDQENESVDQSDDDESNDVEEEEENDECANDEEIAMALDGKIRTNKQLF